MTKHYLHIADFSADELKRLLKLAIQLKQEYRRGGNAALLKNKTLGMIFQKPSLRTRVSFEMGMLHLGGQALNLTPAEIGLGQRESVADVARVLSSYVDILMARTFAHQHILDLARWSSVPVINGLTEYNHPCQALADALTIMEYKDSLKGLKVAFIGDGNNVATSLLHICARLGVHFTIATPPSYELPRAVVELGRAFAHQSGGSVTEIQDQHQAARDADVLYTDTWTSMGQEAEAAVRRAAFAHFTLNAELVSLARPDAIVMHCLPAHRGEEITDEVLDGPHSVAFPQAENRLHAQKAILVELLEAKPKLRRTKTSKPTAKRKR